MNYDPEKHDLVKPVPVWHFWNPYSGMLGTLIFGLLVSVAFLINVTQGLWPALEFSFFTVSIILFARFIETKKLALFYFALFFWCAYATSLLIGLERGENNVKISAIFFLSTLLFVFKSFFVWKNTLRNLQ